MTFDLSDMTLTLCVSDGDGSTPGGTLTEFSSCCGDAMAVASPAAKHPYKILLIFYPISASFKSEIPTSVDGWGIRSSFVNTPTFVH